MSKIDLTSQEWRELVFQGRNKEYGAYKMRSESDKRHFWAMIIVAGVALVGFNIPKLISLVKPNQIENSYGSIEFAPIDNEAEKPAVQKVEPVAPPPEFIKTIRFVAPVITEDVNVKETEEMPSQEKLTNLAGVISTENVEGSVNGKVYKENWKEAVTGTITKDEVYINIEQMPVFPGGEKELLSYIGKNLKYPIIDQENNVQGKVILRFVVSKTGMVDKVEVLRSLSRTADSEAIRVVKSLPKFIPGRQNGANVSVWFTLPVTFKLQD